MDEMNIKECEAAVEAVRKCESEEELGTLLWNMVELNAGSTFYTSKKLPFTYRVKGRPLPKLRFSGHIRKSGKPERPESLSAAPKS